MATHQYRIGIDIKKVVISLNLSSFIIQANLLTFNMEMTTNQQFVTIQKSSKLFHKANERNIYAINLSVRSQYKFLKTPLPRRI